MWTNTRPKPAEDLRPSSATLTHPKKNPSPTCLGFWHPNLILQSSSYKFVSTPPNNTQDPNIRRSPAITSRRHWERPTKEDKRYSHRFRPLFCFFALRSHRWSRVHFQSNEPHLKIAICRSEAASHIETKKRHLIINKSSPTVWVQRDPDIHKTKEQLRIRMWKPNTIFL